MSHSLPTTNSEWHRRVWTLAGPIILSNLSVPLVGAVDTTVVGHLPDPVYIGAVALGALIFSFLYWGFGFLRMGTTGFVAQAFGAKDYAEAAMTLSRAVIVAVGLGFLLVVVQYPVALLAFEILEGSNKLESLAHDYYVIRIWSAPATLANYAVLGFLIGIQRTRAALILQLVLNLSNIFLDIVFVWGFGWGIPGVAAASVISEYTALVAGIVIVNRQLRMTASHWWQPNLFDTTKIRALLHVNLNIFIRTLCLIFAFSYFTAQSTKLGEITLAVNAVLIHLQSFLAYGLDGFAHAVEALSGSAYGARDRTAFRAAVRITTLWALIVSGIYTLVYIALGSTIIGVITGIDDVRSAAAEYLPWILLSPVVSVWSFQLDGIFIGTTHPKEMRNGMLISLVIYLILTWLLIPIWGNHGLWLALMIFMLARALTLGAWYPRIERNLVASC